MTNQLPEQNPWCDLVRSFALPDTPDHVIERLAALVEQLPPGDAAGSLESLTNAYDHGRAILANVDVLSHDHGSVNPYRAAVDMLVRPTDDGAPDPTPAPDPWSGDQHTVKRGRNKRGATRKVTARGVGSVIGAIDTLPDGSTLGPALVPGARDAADIIARLSTVRRRANGRNVLDVTRATDDLYPDLPDLQGTDAMAWATVSLTDLADTPEMALHARFRTDMISFLVQGPTIPTGRKGCTVDRDLYRTSAANLVAPATLAPWPTRVATVRPRKRASETHNLTPFYGLRAYCRPFHRVSLADLVTGYGQTLVIGGTGRPGEQDDPVFYGHSPLLPRGPLAPTNTESTRGNLTRRTVAKSLPIPATLAGWETWCESLEPDTRLTFRDDQYRVTLTRTARGRFTGRVVHGDLVVRFTTRTTTAVARRLHLATT